MKRLVALLCCLAILMSVISAASEGEMILLDELDEEGREKTAEEMAEDDTEELDLEWEEEEEAPRYTLTPSPEPTETPIPGQTPPPTATPVPTPSPEPEDPNSLKIGMSSETVRTLQTNLYRLGYYSGDLSGRYGEKTADAVKAFQADQGLRETGNASPALQQRIAQTQYRALTYGRSGYDVKRVQTRLAYLGFYGGRISGNYLDATVEAMKEFQEKMGEAVTGTASSELLSILFSDKARFAADSALQQKSSAKQAAVVAETVNPNAMPTVKYTKRLAKGSSGAKVRQLQERLTELGYYENSISGSFQGNTRNAVKAFQEQNGLNADGVVGEETWNAIFNSANVVLPGEPPRTTATPEPAPYHLVVDVVNQAVTVYARDEEGNYTVRIKDMICSTGTKANPSPIGDFTLNGRHTLWCLFPKWNDYARYWTQITPSIAFHSVLYNTASTKDLRVASYNKLGRRASHGCVRLLVSDAKWVYDNVHKGTVVTITDKLPADPELRAAVKTVKLNTKTMLPVETPQPTMEPAYISGAQPPLPLTQLGKGMSSTAVYWLQRKLTELGYYSGKCSGTYLEGTVAAVKAYQMAHGLSGSGTANVATLEHLYKKELAAPATFAPALTPAPDVIPTP